MSRIFRSFFRRLTIVAALTGHISLASAAISGSDNFDDDSKNTSRWGTDRASSSAAMTETGRRLQYTSTATTTQIAYRPWILNQATFDTNWEVIADVGNSTSMPSLGAYSSMGFELFPTTGYSPSLYFGLYAATDTGLPALRGFESGLLNGDNQIGYKADTSGTSAGAIRLAFDASTKILTCYTDADGSTGGYVWKKHASYGIKSGGGENGNLNWSMADASTFQLSIYGSSQNIQIASGAMYVDNFNAASSLTAVTNAVTSITGSSATLNATVFTNSLQSTVTFEYSTNADFSSSITTTAQTVSASSSTSPLSRAITNLATGTTYYVRAKATNSSGSVVGNTLLFATPPYKLTMVTENGSVAVSPSQATYSSGTVITLNATPNAGRTFLGWTGDLTGATNPTTLTMSGNKTVTAHFTMDIAPTVDAPAMAFTTGGNANWYGQKIVTRDATGAARSGMITNSQQSWMEITVTGPGKLDFMWKVSSEASDYLEFYIDGLRQANRISGDVDWTAQSYEIAGGSHTLRWRYVKDFIFSELNDTGWVDGITWTPGKAGFALWLSQQFTESELQNTAISGNSADPDHDGISNILEYAFGGNPKSASNTHLPVSQMESIDNQTYLTLTLTRPSYATDVIYTPQVSSELKQWFSGAVHTTVMIDDGTTLKVRDNLAVEPGRKRFMRVEVSVP